MTRFQRTLLWGGVIAIVGAGAAVALYHPADADAKKEAAVAPAAGEPQATPVDVIIAQPEPVQTWNDYSGRLQAVDSVELRPQVSGPIIEVKFKDGQIVNKGDVLFVIDPRPYKAELDQAQADLQKARNEQILAQKDLKRAQELIKSQTIAARLLDERQSNASVAKSSVDAAQARLNQSKLNLDYTNVTAPISGRVSRAEITVGNLVQVGAPVLTRIVSNEGIYADFEVDEQTYLQLINGATKENVSGDAAKIPVKITLGKNKDASANVLDGFIESFDNRIDTSSGTIRARALLDNKDGTLLPGMFVTASMGSPTDENQILVSSDAIGTDQDRKFVYVVTSDNKIAYREVSLGGSANGKRIVTSGLKAGEKVVAGGIMKLRPDMPVQPKVQTAAAPMPMLKEQLKPLIEQ